MYPIDVEQDAQIEPGTVGQTEQAPDGAQAGQSVGGAGLGKCPPPPTVLNARGTPVPAREGLNGGLLKSGGHGISVPQSGRKPESLRIAATKGVEELLPKIIASTVMQADAAVAEGSTDDRRARAHAEAIRGFRGLVEAGPGTKVTNVVEQPELVSRMLDAVRSFEGRVIDPALLVELNDRFTEGMGS